MPRLKYYSGETNQWEYVDNVTGSNIDLTKHNSDAYAHADIREQISKLSGGNVDLTGYATEQWVKDQKYLTAVPDGYAKTSEIPSDSHIKQLINTALGVIENGTY